MTPGDPGYRRRVAECLMADCINKMDQMAKDLKTEDERKQYEAFRDFFGFMGTLAVDFVYGKDGT